MPERLLEELIAGYGSGEYQAEIKSARQEYFRLIPDLREDDSFYERLTACFLNWYVFDRPLAGTPETPLQHFARSNRNQDKLFPLLAQLSGNLHSLFAISEIHAGGLSVEDLFTGETLRIKERRALLGLARGDILEARLLPVAGSLVFSPGAFLVHPRLVAPLLREATAAYRLAGTPGRQQIIAAFQALAFRYNDRYRQRVAAEKLYAEYGRLIATS